MQQEELLRRALALTRRHPFLWLLALLAGEAVGGGSFSSPGGSVSTRSRASSPDTSLAQQQAAQAGAWILANLPLVLAAVLLVALVLAVVGCLAAGALYRGQVELDRGGSFGAGDALRAALHSFGRLLGFRILSALLLIVPLVLLGALSLVMVSAGGAQAVPATVYVDGSFLLFFALFALVSWPVLVLASRSVVLDDRNPLAAVGATIRLVAAEPVRALLTTAVAIGLGIASGIANGVVLTLVSLPFLGGLVESLQALDLAQIATALLPLVAVEVVVSLVLGSVIGCFYSGYWTLGFEALKAADAGRDRAG